MTKFPHIHKMYPFVKEKKKLNGIIQQSHIFQ